MNKEFIKVVKKNEKTGELYIQFTEDEMKKLGIRPTDEFSFKICEGGFLLKKRKKTKGSN